ncbi:MAG TPA: HEAT repeat domain-containing protein [Planctomycetota bacterium]
MTRWILPLALAASFLLAGELSAHGGTYRGPGDTVPPSGGGAATPTAPTAPTTPSAPSSPTTPSAPGAPATPTTPAAAPATTTTTPPAVTGTSAGPDLTTWEFWWEFNKEPYLNLKAKVQGAESTTGEGDLLLGMSAGVNQAKTRAPSKQQIQGVIVPALRSALQNSDDRDISTAALVALAKIGADPSIPPLFEPFLADRNQEIKETAGLAYGIYQAAEALPTLRALLLDNAEGRGFAGKATNVDIRSRTFAAYGLGMIGRAESDPAVKQDIAKTLWQVLNADDSALKDMRVACVISLGLLNLEDPTEMVRNLSTYLANDSNDDLVRSHCPNAIAKLLRSAPIESPATEDAVNQFLALLGGRSTNNWIRESCVQALGMLTKFEAPYSSQVVSTLMEVADKGKDRQEKNFSAIALAYIGSTTDVGSRKKITEFLLGGLDGKFSTPYRTWAGLGLGVMAFKVQEGGGQVSSVVPAALLASFNKAKNPSEKACYAVALGLMKNESAKNDIRAAMEDARDPSFRGYAAVALGLMGAREHKDYISKVVMDSRRLPDLLRQASIGLGLMSDREVVTTLLKLLEGEDGSTPPLSVLAATATALGFIGDASSVDPLVRMLENENDYTPLARAFAAVALGIVADKEYLPWNSKVSEDLNYRAAVDTLTDSRSGSGLLDIL